MYCKMLIYGIFVFAFVYVGKAQDDEPLEKLSSCSCRLPNSTVVDLTPLASSTDEPRWLDELPADSTPWRYSYNPCNPFTLKTAATDEGTLCNNVAICQRDTSKKKAYYYNIGLQETAAFTLKTSPTIRALLSKVQFTNGVAARMADKLLATPDQRVVISYMDKVEGTPERNGVVILMCSDTPTFQVVGSIPSTTPYEYVMILADPTACPSGGGGGGGRHGGLSIGSIICIVFFVVIIIYIIAGVLFMKYVRHANGADLVPNREFWTALPSYVKDGSCFTIGKVTRKGDSYQKI